VLDVEGDGAPVVAYGVGAEVGIGSLHRGAVFVGSAFAFVVGGEFWTVGAHDLKRVVARGVEGENSLRIWAVELEARAVGLNVIDKDELPGADETMAGVAWRLGECRGWKFANDEAEKQD